MAGATRGGEGGEEEKHERGEKQGELASLPKSLFLFPFLPIPSRRLLRGLQSRVFFRLSFMVYIDGVGNRKEKELQLD